jgi:hypothetical protein
MTATIEKLTPKDFASNQEVRWCPGCGDYSILKQVQTVLPDLGRPKEEFVFISVLLAFLIIWIPLGCTRYMAGQRLLLPV